MVVFLLAEPPPCGENLFTCLSGICIPEDFHCDGALDCGEDDDSDEVDCFSKSCIPVYTKAVLFNHSPQ